MISRFDAQRTAQMHVHTLIYTLRVHVAVFRPLWGSKVYAADRMRNITPAFTVIVILNVVLICVTHNSKCRHSLITHKDIYLCWAVVSICPACRQFKICLPSPIPIIWRQSTALVWNVQLSIFFMCDWRAEGGPLKPNMDPGLTLQSIGLFPASYQVHVLCPLISEYDSGHPWILFLSVMKVSPGNWLKDSLPLGSRRGWGFLV